MMEVRKLSTTFGVQVQVAAGCLGLPATTEALKSLVHKHRLVLVKLPGTRLGGDAQVDLSRAFGTLHSTFSKHPRSPHPDVFRVSNDPAEGCTQVGTSGFHVDGTFELRPFKIQTMHFHATARGGDTIFVPLKEFFESQPEPVRERWSETWMVTKYGVVHPLVYQHPTRHEPTMLFHCGASFVSGWSRAAPGELPDVSRPVAPAHEMQAELTERLASFEHSSLRVAWEPGDLALCDNLALAHFATDGTQAAPEEAGLRVLHRTTVAGDSIPRTAGGLSSFKIASSQ